MKFIDFSMYKKITRLPLNQFNRYIESIYKSGLEDGAEQVMEQSNGIELWQIEIAIKSTEGVGKKTTDKIITNLKKLLYEGIDDGDKSKQ